MYHSKRRELKQLQMPEQICIKKSHLKCIYLWVRKGYEFFFFYLGIVHLLNDNLTRFLTFLNINLEFGQFL